MLKSICQMNILRVAAASDTGVKNHLFGRWTAQKRAVFYLGRYVDMHHREERTL